MILLTGNEGQKETKEIKLEQLVVVVMAMGIFVLLVVKMIGGKNMEQAQLITLADYINLE
jgi:purine nucleoside phosphorylase